MEKQTISEKIKQRRNQILVHSYLYYILDQTIVDDVTWAKWAKELETLQKTYPEEAAKAPYADEFKDWDGSSGAYLNFDDHTKHAAEYLLKKEGRQ